MARIQMQVGEIYGGVRVYALVPGDPNCLVQCLKCNGIVEKDRSNIRSKRIMSCGRSPCKGKSVTFNGMTNNEKASKGR